MSGIFSVIVCWWRGHQWGEPVKHSEWWHAYEEVGENGGYRMGYGPCGPNDEDAVLNEWQTRECSRCKRSERI